MKDKLVFQSLSELAVKAGEEIMKIYSGEIEVELKDDLSPLTAADKASHNVITGGLAEVEILNSRFPVVSEEGEIPGFDQRKSWDYFWMIDPLDGTKEFIKRRDEFTVNIALIEKDHPYIGLVYLPVKKTLYFGGINHGSYKVAADDTDFEYAVSLPLEQGGSDVLKAAGSRSHRSSEFDGWVEAEAKRRGCRSIEIVTAGSSLKFCLAAEGLVDVYPRFGPTMEWDTAAAQAVLEGAGGKCTRVDGSRMIYNKPVLKNDGFLVYREDPKWL